MCRSEQRESEGDRPLQGRCMVRARHGNGRTVPNGTQPTEIFGVCFNNSQNKDSPWGSRLWAVVVGSWSGGCDAAGSGGLWAQPTHLCANESRGGGSGDERCCWQCSSSGKCENNCRCAVCESGARCGYEADCEANGDCRCEAGRESDACDARCRCEPDVKGDGTARCRCEPDVKGGGTARCRCEPDVKGGDEQDPNGVASGTGPGRLAGGDGGPRRHAYAKCEQDPNGVAYGTGPRRLAGGDGGPWMRA